MKRATPWIRSTGNVAMPRHTVKLRTAHPQTDFNPLLYYATDHEQNTVLGRTCELYIHRSANGARSAWVTDVPASLFLDLFSARKGWEGHRGVHPRSAVGAGHGGTTLVR
jgi:hypothetical protein